MKVSDFIKIIEEYAPPNLAPFDFEGLIHGLPDQSVDTISFSLDGTLQAIKESIKNGSQLLVVHHGLLDHKEYPSSLDLEKIKLLHESKLAVYRAHLNLDFCKKGIIDNMCALMGLYAEPTYLRYKSYLIYGGAYVSVGNNISLPNLLVKIRSRLRPPRIRVYGKELAFYDRIAVASGSGAQIGFISQLQCDAFIVGEASYEAQREAEDCGCALIELTHYSSENLPFEICAENIMEKLNGIKWHYIRYDDACLVY